MTKFIMPCPVQLHHGPGHQSTTECEELEAHEVHRCIYGGWRREATWTGGDVFTGYFDEPPGENPEYVSDSSWYTPEHLERYMPKWYKDPRL